MHWSELEELERMARRFRNGARFEPFRGEARAVDLDGNPVEHTKRDRPYSYSAFVTGRSAPNHPKMTAVYVDRMWSWDRSKMERLTKQHLSDTRWQHPRMSAVQAFMRAYMDDSKLQVIAVMEWCNAATGFPTWSIHYVSGEDL